MPVRGGFAPIVLRRFGVLASALLLAYCVSGPVPYLLVALVDGNWGPVRPSAVPSGPLSLEGPILWGRVVLTVENRTQHTLMLDEASVGGVRAFGGRRLRPAGDRSAAHTDEVAQRPGPHRVLIASKPEGAASPSEQWFDVEVEAGYELRCLVVLQGARAEMEPCERGDRIDPYRLFN